MDRPIFGGRIAWSILGEKSSVAKFTTSSALVKGEDSVFCVMSKPARLPIMFLFVSSSLCFPFFFFFFFFTIFVGLGSGDLQVKAIFLVQIRSDKNRSNPSIGSAFDPF